MVCDVGSVTWTVTWLYAVRRGLAGHQCRWNVEVQPVSVRTFMTRRQAADTAPCPTCAGRSCSVWACRPRPTATSTVSSNDLCCSSQSCCCCYIFVYLDVLRTHTYNHVDMFSMLFTTDRSTDYWLCTDCFCQLCSPVTVVVFCRSFHLCGCIGLTDQ